jgi:uncharacterized protein (DUF433 family)
MNSCNRVICDPNVLGGKPTRTSVERILGWLASGWSHEMILAAYPQLTQEDIVAVLAFAAE